MHILNICPWICSLEGFLAIQVKGHKSKSQGKDYKSELKTITGILTGNNGLNYHMHQIGKSRDENCRMCLEESATAQHIMCESPAIARIRLKH
jgi:hypothetical protein